MPDVDVVGSGPNGLAAAAVMARAGLSVEVHEAAATIGGGTRTVELMQPGHLHDVCSAVHPMALASLTRLVPASQILFGSDYPYRTGEDHVKGLMEYGVTAADRRAIDRDNALRLLPRLSRDRL